MIKTKNKIKLKPIVSCHLHTSKRHTNLPNTPSPVSISHSYAITHLVEFTFTQSRKSMIESHKFYSFPHSNGAYQLN